MRTVFVTGLIVAWVASKGATGEETFQANNVEALQQALKQAQPGDRILLAPGRWHNVQLKIDAEGTPEAAVVIAAATPGETVLTGRSSIQIGGRYVVVEGLKLHNLTGDAGDWIEFRRDSKRTAEHCVLQDCWLVQDQPLTDASPESRWIGIYGSNNTLLRCRIEGKQNRGTTVVVWLGDKNRGQHRIAWNDFGPRPPLSTNGGETLRIGDSKTSLLNGSCVVENNWFNRCDGETECISNKSCENIYRGNTFVEVQGTLTLRHGHRCRVEENLFFGNHRTRTGGIRVIGEGHQVVGNQLYDLEGDRFRAAIVLVNGEMDAALNGYQPVRDVQFLNNLIVDCKEAFRLGYNDERGAIVAPRDTVIEGQRVVLRSGRRLISDTLGSESTDHSVRWINCQVSGDTEVGSSLPAGVAFMEQINVARPRVEKSQNVGPRWIPH